MKLPSEIEKEKKQITPSMIKQLESLQGSLREVIKNPEYNMDSLKTLTSVQASLIVFVENYYESLFSLSKRGYEVD